ncbi:MAG: darcynin [Myxococcaceae bacterium]|nr:darcynin [Myxococcaceae bacterium]MCA3014326.1 darcynin [Myxococcaceae bacterium]
MLVKTTTAWLAKPPKERFAFLGASIEPILARHPAVKMRFFDAEAFSARVSDVIVWETQALGEYQAIVEALRETEFWGTYFEVVDIIPSIENAYASHYEVAPVGG